MSPAERETPAGEAMREAVAQWFVASLGKSIEQGRRAADDLLSVAGPIASELARLTAERDEAEQRVTNLANALTSAHRARGEQEKRADKADDRRVTLEKDRIHPAFSVEVQEHRQQAYEGGWTEGYAEGFAKSQSTAEAALTTLRADHAAEVARKNAEIADLRGALEDTKAAADDLAQVCLNERDNKAAGALQFISGFVSDRFAALAPKETTDA